MNASKEKYFSIYRYWVAVKIKFIDHYLKGQLILIAQTNIKRIPRQIFLKKQANKKQEREKKKNKTFIT